MPDDCRDMYPGEQLRPGALPNLSREGAKLYPTVVGTDLPAVLQPHWLWMTGKLADWLRWHFGSTTRIEFPSLKDRVWTDQPDTKIWIGSLAEWKPELSGQRPAILIDRAEQDVDTQHMGIGGNQLMGGVPGYYAQYMVGNHAINCLGGREGETDYLAAEVWRELSRYANKVREWLCLARFRPVRTGRRRQLDEHKEVYTVPVFVSYAYAETFAVAAADESPVTAIRSTLRTS